MKVEGYYRYLTAMLLGCWMRTWRRISEKGDYHTGR